MARDSVLQGAPFPDLWQFATSDHRVLALVRPEKLLAGMQATVVPDNLPTHEKIILLPPGVENTAAFVSLPAGPRWPGWRLAVSLQNEKLFDAATEHRTAVYLWTGILMVAAMGVLTLLAIRLLRRQAALA